MKILILTLSAPSNNKKTDTALKSINESTSRDCSIEMLDVLKYINSFLNGLIKKGYIRKLRNIYFYYENLINSTKSFEDITDMTEKLNLLLCHKIKKHIKEIQPDVILCFHHLPLKILRTLNDRDGINALKASYITKLFTKNIKDYEFLDACFAKEEDVIKELIDIGVETEKIFSLEELKASTFKKILGN
ncbi:monogalactosyldiacylglycerol (MGDG) synthase [Oxobacter pfennigii]|uniref:Monogalactosyldiacylglycerol (MGDG) synthase n=1 Tax=Oxobacter pfennigii TaxID=36849 RepID=A0A0P8W7E9_9CLOT|nr:hypothetical protein [Oxobacter pfennigii]KPU44582.1 monogalactosyldiacylglycerol (MGDG) synthase [Oxobacter pfennigii]